MYCSIKYNILWFALILLIQTTLIYSTDRVPGIDYITQGYNMFIGNPHTTTGNIDPGIYNPIFNISDCNDNSLCYMHSICSPGDKLVPNPISILESSTCAEQFKFSAMSGINAYSSSLHETATIDINIPGSGASFGLSTDFQSVYKSVSSQQSVYTSSYIQCSCYKAMLNDPNDLPSFSTNFIKSVASMPTQYDQNNTNDVDFFYQFFDLYFGTHYISSIEMGGMFGTLSSVDRNSYSQFTSSNLDIQVSSQLSTIYASGAASSLTDIQQQQAKDFNSIVKEKKIFNIGGNLPADNNISEWQQSLSSNPMPIKYNAVEITKLLTPTNFPDDFYIQNKQTAAQNALYNYCTLIMERKNISTFNCSGYAPDPALPSLSIVKGFYPSNEDYEPKNPYNNDSSCTPPFKPIQYSRLYYNPSKGLLFDLFYCINQTQYNLYKKDALNYFGGFYEKCVLKNGSYNICNNGNYLNNDQCSCPVGYTSQMVLLGYTDTFNKNCYVTPKSQAKIAKVQIHLCRNATTSSEHTTMTGTYTVYDKSGCSSLNKSDYVNPYTKTTTCLFGFAPYKISTACCSWGPQNGCTGYGNTYVCLNDIYSL